MLVIVVVIVIVLIIIVVIDLIIIIIVRVTDDGAGIGTGSDCGGSRVILVQFASLQTHNTKCTRAHVDRQDQKKKKKGVNVVRASRDDRLIDD